MNRGTLRKFSTSLVTIVFAVTATTLGASADPAPSTDLPVQQEGNADHDGRPVNLWTNKAVTASTDSDDKSELVGVVVVQVSPDAATA
jgi:hypothetical protein